MTMPTYGLPGGRAAPIPLSTLVLTPARLLPRADWRIRARLLALFSVPREALPAGSPARKRLVSLILLGYEIHVYPRLGAFDLDDAANWCAYLHDHRMTLAEYLAHWEEVPIPAFPHGVPLLSGLASEGEGIGADESGAGSLEIAL